MDEIRKKPKEEVSGAEEDALRDMRLVEEMYARGLEFLPIDLYQADDLNCLIIDGKIMPPFCSIEGVAGKAAEQLKEAVKALRENNPEAKFISKEDLRLRSKIGKSTIEKMTSLGLLNGLPESSQLSIFDF
jgi:DNA polymerase-3 subunit alpha (Gram-positive type)